MFFCYKFKMYIRPNASKNFKPRNSDIFRNYFVGIKLRHSTEYEKYNNNKIGRIINC